MSWSSDSSINSCIWECVYESNCQTAVYFTNEGVCSLFTESCQSKSIVPSGNVQASVICYPKGQGNCICFGATIENKKENYAY